MLNYDSNLMMAKQNKTYSVMNIVYTTNEVVHSSGRKFVQLQQLEPNPSGRTRPWGLLSL
jgi:hypothetical protein